MGPGQSGVYPEFVESLIELFNFLKKQCNFLMTLKKKKNNGDNRCFKQTRLSDSFFQFCRFVTRKIGDFVR